MDWTLVASLGEPGVMEENPQSSGFQVQNLPLHPEMPRSVSVRYPYLLGPSLLVKCSPQPSEPYAAGGGPLSSRVDFSGLPFPSAQLKFPSFIRPPRDRIKIGGDIETHRLISLRFVLRRVLSGKTCSG